MLKHLEYCHRREAEASFSEHCKSHQLCLLQPWLHQGGPGTLCVVLQRTWFCLKVWLMSYCQNYWVWTLAKVCWYSKQVEKLKVEVKPNICVEWGCVSLYTKNSDNTGREFWAISSIPFSPLGMEGGEWNQRSAFCAYYAFHIFFVSFQGYN